MGCDFQMDAYEWHREKINFLLQRMISVAADELDMFSDEPAVTSSATTAPTTIGQEEKEEDTVKWDYKSNEEAKIEVYNKFSIFRYL